jgi:hypothetical protein
MRNKHKVAPWKPEGKRPLWIPKSCWGDKNKINFNTVIKWIIVMQGRVQWHILVNLAMNFRCYARQAISWPAGVDTGFSRKTSRSESLHANGLALHTAKCIETTGITNSGGETQILQVYNKQLQYKGILDDHKEANQTTNSKIDQ